MNECRDGKRMFMIFYGLAYPPCRAGFRSLRLGLNRKRRAVPASGALRRNIEYSILM